MDTKIYDLLVERARSPGAVRRMLLGSSWSVAEVAACGLCFSPQEVPRTLSWPGTIKGRAASEVTPWIGSPEAATATVGAAVINAVINDAQNPWLRQATPLPTSEQPHLAVFAHFTAEVSGARVVVVGRYPGLEQLWAGSGYQCLERKAFPDTLPESAAERVLPGADWAFITASALANKTLPRLLSLARGARVVLMGPSLPWLGEWSDFGVHYLAGVEVMDRPELVTIASEGGGTRIFERAVRYRVLRLT